MFNNLQIRTCHTFVTLDRRPIKLYEIGQWPRGLDELPHANREVDELLRHCESFLYRGSSLMTFVFMSTDRFRLKVGTIEACARTTSVLHWNARRVTDNNEKKKRKTRDASRANARYRGSRSQNRKQSIRDVNSDLGRCWML